MMSPQAARVRSFIARGSAAPRSAMEQRIDSGAVQVQGDAQLQADDLRRVVKALRQNAPLHTIEIEDAHVGNEGVKGIAEALKANETLTSLSLCNANITGAGVSHLADALKSNHTLKVLRLRSNKLGHIGTQRLAAALKLNEALRHLDLTDTAMDKHGAQQISEALFVNGGVEIICLGSNPIGSDGALAIANAIRANGALTRIDLSDTDLDEEGLVYILDALQFSQSVQFIAFPSTLASSTQALTRLQQLLMIPHPRSALTEVAGCELPSHMDLMLPPHIQRADNQIIIRFLRRRAHVYRSLTTSFLRERGWPLNNLHLLHDLVFGDGWDRFSVDAGFVSASPRALSQRLSPR